jgi:hypothetical protein
MLLKSLGRSGLAELVERTCAHVQRFAAGLRDAGCEVLNEVVINQVLVSFGDAAKTQEVIRRLQEEGTCGCGGTVWQSKTVRRISVSSWATTERGCRPKLGSDFEHRARYWRSTLFAAHYAIRSAMEPQ